MRRALTFAVPAGAVTAGAVMAAYAVARTEGNGMDQARTAATMVFLMSSLWVLAVQARPLRRWKTGLVSVCVGRPAGRHRLVRPAADGGLLEGLVGDGIELGVRALFAAWNLVTYWISTVAATPGITYRQAMVVTQSTTAVANTLPGGSAISVGLSYSMLRSWGFSKSRITVSMIVAGIWNNFVKLGMPVLALALLAFQGEASGSRTVAGMAGIGALVVAVVVFALMLRSEHFGYRAGDATGRAAGRCHLEVPQPGHRPGARPLGPADHHVHGELPGRVDAGQRRRPPGARAPSRSTPTGAEVAPRA